MTNLPRLQYDFKELIDTARIHNRQTYLEPPYVYKNAVIKERDNRSLSIGKVTSDKSKSKQNHFNLGKRLIFQSEKLESIITVKIQRNILVD